MLRMLVGKDTPGVCFVTERGSYAETKGVSVCFRVVCFLFVTDLKRVATECSVCSLMAYCTFASML